MHHQQQHRCLTGCAEPSIYAPSQMPSHYQVAHAIFRSRRKAGSTQLASVLHLCQTAHYSRARVPPHITSTLGCFSSAGGEPVLQEGHVIHQESFLLQGLGFEVATFTPSESVEICRLRCASQLRGRTQHLQEGAVTGAISHFATASQQLVLTPLQSALPPVLAKPALQPDLCQPCSAVAFATCVTSDSLDLHSRLRGICHPRRAFRVHHHPSRSRCLICFRETLHGHRGLCRFWTLSNRIVILMPSPSPCCCCGNDFGFMIFCQDTLLSACQVGVVPYVKLAP